VGARYVSCFRLVKSAVDVPEASEGVPGALLILQASSCRRTTGPIPYNFHMQQGQSVPS
jgi:hypothetical protein